MKIAILTSGILPIPAVQGGAVENLADFYLEYNNQHRLHDITVYSVWHPKVESHPALQSDVNHYIYIKVSGWWAKLRKKWYQLTHGKEYYHYTIEYYLHEAMKEIQKKDFDIILMENRPAYALKIKKISNAKLVYHLHNEKLDKRVPKFQEIYDAVDGILTVSNYIKKCVQTINPLDQKTQTIYNGINLAAFRKNVTIDRTALGFRNDDFVLIFSGRINREKGIMELIEAINQLTDYPQIKLMVLGSSFYGNVTDEDDFTRELRFKAESLKERIIFTGFIPYPDIPEYLSIADVAVIPSVWDDPFPTTVLEAQAMGQPIITTRRGGIPEEVTEKNAILLQTDEHFVKNLANAILELYQHPEKRKLMSKASIENSKYFNHQRYAEDLLKSLKGLLDICPKNYDIAQTTL